MRSTILLCAVLTGACASSSAYFGGTLDLQRVDRGEVFLDQVTLPDGRYMFRTVLTVDAPPSAILSVYRDVTQYPTWQPSIVNTKVTGGTGDQVHAEITFAPVFGRQFSPVPNVIRIDREHSQISQTGFETDWLRSSETLIKAEHYGDGRRTLVTGYSIVDVKAFGSSLGTGRAADLLAQGMRNLQTAARLPRHLTEPAAGPAGESAPRVAVPGFQAQGVDPDLAGSLTRVFVRELMNSGRWTIVTYGEAAALLAHSHRTQLIGCDPTTACGLDLAAAISANHLIAGTVSRVGEVYLLTASLMSLPSGAVLRRVTAEGRDVAGLLEQVRVASADLARADGLLR